MESTRSARFYECYVELFGVLTMNAIKWKNALYLLLIIATFVSIINWIVSEKEFTIKFVMDCIAKSVTVITFISWIFCYKLWKFRFFRKWLVLIPNLNGVWTGSIESNWVNPKSNDKYPAIPATLIINQSLFKTSCLIKTNESSSLSITADFVIDNENQICKLVYTYQNDSKQTLRNISPIHYGTANIDIIENNDKILLRGSYWTDRNSSGDLFFAPQIDEKNK